MNTLDRQPNESPEDQLARIAASLQAEADASCQNTHSMIVSPDGTVTQQVFKPSARALEMHRNERIAERCERVLRLMRKYY